MSIIRGFFTVMFRWWFCASLASAPPARSGVPRKAAVAQQPLAVSSSGPHTSPTCCAYERRRSAVPRLQEKPSVISHRLPPRVYRCLTLGKRSLCLERLSDPQRRERREHEKRAGGERSVYLLPFVSVLLLILSLHFQCHSLCLGISTRRMWEHKLRLPLLHPFRDVACHHQSQTGDDWVFQAAGLYNDT